MIRPVLLCHTRLQHQQSSTKIPLALLANTMGQVDGQLNTFDGRHFLENAADLRIDRTSRSSEPINELHRHSVQRLAPPDNGFEWPV